MHEYWVTDARTFLPRIASLRTSARNDGLRFVDCHVIARECDQNKPWPWQPDLQGDFVRNDRRSVNCTKSPQIMKNLRALCFSPLSLGEGSGVRPLILHHLDMAFTAIKDHIYKIDTLSPASCIGKVIGIITR